MQLLNLGRDLKEENCQRLFVNPLFRLSVKISVNYCFYFSNSISNYDFCILSNLSPVIIKRNV